MKHGKRILSIVMTAILLTGCGGTGMQGEAGPEMTEEAAMTEPEVTGQEVTGQEATGREKTSVEPAGAEAEERETTGATATEPETATDAQTELHVDLEKKQPPEGWELVFASEEWGLSFGESGTRPVGNASAEDLAWYDACYVGEGDEKVIYLTFDCGYENGNTAPILDALKKHHAAATFFVVGHFLETAPDLAKRMVDEGHAVGNHTYHHPDMSAIADKEAFQKELDDVEELFYEITGTKLSPYYRPPQGKCNAENIKMAQELGYATIFWSLAYVDWDTERQPSHAEAFDKLTSRIHPGAIVLLHNTSQTNGEILDELLTKWEEMGYSFRPLSDIAHTEKGN